jgi:hypothetical protein
MMCVTAYQMIGRGGRIREGGMGLGALGVGHRHGGGNLTRKILRGWGKKIKELVMVTFLRSRKRGAYREAQQNKEQKILVIGAWGLIDRASGHATIEDSRRRGDARGYRFHSWWLWHSKRNFGAISGQKKPIGNLN